jgi:hypothetical protein
MGVIENKMRSDLGLRGMRPNTVKNLRALLPTIRGAHFLLELGKDCEIGGPTRSQEAEGLLTGGSTGADRLPRTGGRSTG